MEDKDLDQVDDKMEEVAPEATSWIARHAGTVLFLVALAGAVVACRMVL